MINPFHTGRFKTCPSFHAYRSPAAAVPIHFAGWSGPLGARLVAAVAAAVFAIGLGAARGDDGIPPTVLQSIKKASVFVKIKAADVEGSGSGFVVKIDGGSAFVVTNDHVIEPEVLEIVEKWANVPAAPSRSPYPGRGRQGTRGYAPFPGRAGIAPGLPGLPPSLPGPFGNQPAPQRHRELDLVVRRLKDVEVTVVFRSGNSGEQSIKGEVIGTDRNNDLAIIKVPGVSDPPPPIDIKQELAVSETMPVYSFGFPFGKELSSGHGNPAITIGKAAVSSLRMDDSGQLARIQIDGALNPGNSGGPIVDVHGTLIGVAVATIRGSTGIGLIIPAKKVVSLLKGELEEPHMTLVRSLDGNLQLAVQAHLIDPLRNLKTASVHYITADKLTQPPKPTDRLADLAGCWDLPLTFQEHLAVAHKTLKKEVGKLSVVCQSDAIDAEGKHHYSNIATIVLQAPPAAGARPSTGLAPAGMIAPVVADDPPPQYAVTDPLTTAGDLSVVLSDLKSASFTRRTYAVMRLAGTTPSEPHPDVAKALESTVVSERVPAIRVNAAAAMAAWGTTENLPASPRFPHTRPMCSSALGSC